MDATRQLRLRSVPPYLCLSLQRFVFDLKARSQEPLLPLDGPQQAASQNILRRSFRLICLWAACTFALADGAHA